jgi:O-antigen/teichoic acid export membrane protein
MTSVFPLMSGYFKQSPESLTKAYAMAFRLMISIILPVAVVVTLLAPRIIGLLYGSKFSASAPALSILIWAQVFVYVNAVMHFMIISVKRQKATMINLALVAFLNIALNYTLIPAHGFIGTGSSRVITEAFGSVLGLFWLSSFGYRIPLFGIISKPLLGALAAGAFLACFPAVSMYLTLPAAALIYFSIEIVSGGITKEDVAILKGCFARDGEAVYAGA